MIGPLVLLKRMLGLVQKNVYKGSQCVFRGQKMYTRKANVFPVVSIPARTMSNAVT